jgi:hypothetical protein
MPRRIEDRVKVALSFKGRTLIDIRLNVCRAVFLKVIASVLALGALLAKLLLTR